MNKGKTGVLLTNIGSPNSLTLKDVKIYLNKFLMDPKVIDLPYIIRKILVSYIIVPTRSKKTLEAYSEVWTKEGSPLIINSIKSKDKLAKALGNEYEVALGMSYSNPTIEDSIDYLINKKSCTSILIIPMYPQYAEATNGSSIEQSLQYLKKNHKNINVKIIDYFHYDINYIKAITKVIANNLKNISYDHILFSYHGLPERQIKNITDQTKNYKRHCYETSCFITSQLNISADKYSTSLQSRLGKIPWIQPYTDDMLITLAKKGIKNLVVICPSFVYDCLETLEEIGLRAKEDWLKLGGKNFFLIPCLNDDSLWISSFSSLIKERSYNDKENPRC